MATIVLILFYGMCCLGQAIAQGEEWIDLTMYYDEFGHATSPKPRVVEQTPCHETRDCLLTALGRPADLIYNSTNYIASDVENCMLPCHAEWSEPNLVTRMHTMRATYEAKFYETYKPNEFQACMQRAGFVGFDVNAPNLYTANVDYSSPLQQDIRQKMHSYCQTSKLWSATKGEWIGHRRAKRHVEDNNNQFSTIGASSVAETALMRTLMTSRHNENLQKCPRAASQARACINRVTNGKFVVPDPKQVFSSVCELMTKCDPERTCSTLRAEFDRNRCECFKHGYHRFLVSAGAEECTRLKYFESNQRLYCLRDFKYRHQVFEHRCNIGEPLTLDELIEIFFDRLFAPLYRL